MKYVLNLFSPIPKLEKSHTFGWSRYWCAQLGSTILRNLHDITENDEVYVDHGVNFSGNLNLFNGVPDEMASGLYHLIQVKPKLFSLDIPMPDYAKMLVSRIGNRTTSELITEDFLKKFEHFLDTSETLLYPNKKPSWLTVGDSHSTAFAKIGSEVNRTNGLTLHGLLSNFEERFPDLSTERYSELKGITLVAGSIDIRHHIFRQERPAQAIQMLLDELLAKADLLKNKFNVDVELCSTVPVEHEDRKLPKTGYYKGTPFFGSHSERSEATKTFIEILTKNWKNVCSAPNEWYTMHPAEYAKTVMENGGSVHISPVHYRSVLNDWK